MISRILHNLFALTLVAMAPSYAAADSHADDEGGIIGTGILGTITRLGSIVVNEQVIRFAPDLDVAGSVPRRTAASLLPGHVVAATVMPDGAGWQSVDLRQILPLVGPVDRIAEGKLFVMGSEVDIGTMDVSVAPGEWIAVSGTWKRGGVMASRIDRVSSDVGARISGSYLGPTATGAERIGNTILEGLTLRNAEPGDHIRAIGTPIDGGLRVERVETGLFAPMVRIVQAEGYLSAPMVSGLYTVLGSGLVAFTDNPGMINPDARTIMCAVGRSLTSPLTATGLTAAEAELAARLGCN